MPFRISHKLIAPLLALLLLIAQSIGLSSSAWSDDAAVNINNFTFTAAVLTVKPGPRSPGPASRLRASRADFLREMPEKPANWRTFRLLWGPNGPGVRARVSARD